MKSLPAILCLGLGLVGRALADEPVKGHFRPDGTFVIPRPRPPGESLSLTLAEPDGSGALRGSRAVVPAPTASQDSTTKISVQAALATKGSRPVLEADWLRQQIAVLESGLLSYRADLAALSVKESSARADAPAIVSTTGDLQVGMSRQQVRQLCREPNSVAVDDRGLELWRYPTLMVCFSNAKVVSWITR